MSEKVPFSIKLGYGIGDYPIQMLINAVIFYQLFYFTDVYMISAGAAGLIILVSRVVQAFSNPLIGIFSDRSSFKWGKKRPFIFIGLFPLGLSFMLLFGGPELEMESRIVYAFVTSLIFFIAFSTVAIPYSSMTAVLTRDFHERSSLSGIRMIFTITGALTAAGLFKPMAAWFGGGYAGYRYVAMIFGALTICILLITVYTVSEKKEGSEPDEKSTTFFNDLLLLTKNRPFMILAVASFFFMLGVNSLATVINYYFKYNLKAEAFVPAAFLAIYVSATLAVPLFVSLSRRTSKKAAFMAGMALVAGELIFSYVTEVSSLQVMMVLLVIAGIGVSTIFLSPWSMVPDTVEYLQWKTGLRREGLLYGLYILFFNLSAATTGFVVGLGLDCIGYVPNAAQSHETLEGIRVLMTLVPVTFLLLGLVVIYFYPIDEKMHRKMVKDIMTDRIGEGL